MYCVLVPSNVAFLLFPCMNYIMEHFSPKIRKEEYFEKELKKISILLDYFTVLPLKTNGEIYGHIKYELKKKGKPVDEFDMVIASHAVSEGLTLGLIISNTLRICLTLRL